MTRRDLLVAAVAVLLTLTGVAGMQPKPAPLGSQVWDRKDMVARPNATGEVRTIVRAPTATLDELEIHITTLKPGVVPTFLMLCRWFDAWKMIDPGPTRFNSPSTSASTVPSRTISISSFGC